MSGYLDSFRSSISDSQNSIIDRYTNIEERGAIPIKDAINLLSSVGNKIFSIPENSTNPTEFNKALIAIISDLTALYNELDSIYTLVSSVNSVNNSQLETLEKNITELERTLKNNISIARSKLDYTHIITESFVEDTSDKDKLPSNYYALYVDPVSQSLRRPLVGDISRTLFMGKRQMCEITIEDMLGLSSENLHGPENLIDGDYSTFWRETILADSPIYAPPTIASWLPPNYTGGAAVKLRIDFDYITPITELSLKPACPYPMNILSVEWSTRTVNDKESGSTIPINGNFSDGLTGWNTTSSGSSGWIEATAGMDGSQCLEVETYYTSSLYGLARNINFYDHTGTQKNLLTTDPRLYGLSFLLKRLSISGTVEILVSGTTPEGEPTVFYRRRINASASTSKDWQLFSYFFRVPDIEFEYLTVEFKFTGGVYIAYLDDIQLNTNLNQKIIEDKEITTDKIIRFPKQKGNFIACKTLWITLEQPNYTLKTYNIPESFTEMQELWDGTLLSPDSSIYSEDESLRDEITKNIPTLLPETQEFYRQVNNLGTKIKQLIVKLYNIAYPSENTINITKYEYILAGWELDIRYREYRRSGLWVSKPIDVRGEVRELKLIPTHEFENDAINYYISLKDSDIVDTTLLTKLHKDSSYGIRIKASDELSKPEYPYISISPIDYKDVFVGTNRYQQVSLTKYPYINKESINTIMGRITREDSTGLVSYDPNASMITFPTVLTSGTAWASGTQYYYGSRVEASSSMYICTSGHIAAAISQPASGASSGLYWSLDSTALRSIQGYRPIEVTLTINGVKAYPDMVGDSGTSMSRLITKEILQEDTGDSSHSESIEGETRYSGVTKKSIEENKVVVRTFTTKYPVEWDPTANKANRVALYWHDPTNDTADVLDTTNDIYINPAYYEILQVGGTGTTETGQFYGRTRIIMKDEGFNQITIKGLDTNDIEYDLVGYYRTKMSLAGYLATEEYKLETQQVSGLAPLLSQTYPVTRNKTDYYMGSKKELRKSQPIKTEAGYYPVYEYVVHEDGTIEFADDFYSNGDFPAKIEVKYKTLDITPRLVIEMDSPIRDGIVAGTPVVYDYTLLVNARKL